MSIEIVALVLYTLACTYVARIWSYHPWRTYPDAVPFTFHEIEDRETGDDGHIILEDI